MVIPVVTFSLRPCLLLVISLFADFSAIEEYFCKFNHIIIKVKSIACDPRKTFCFLGSKGQGKNCVLTSNSVVLNIRAS